MNVGWKSTVAQTLVQALLVGAVTLVPRGSSAQTKVRFERGDKPSVVAVEGSRCTTPCSLLLTTGTHTVKIDGNVSDVKVPETKGSDSAHFRSDIDIVNVAGGSIVAGIGLTVSLITLLVAAGALSGTDDNGDPTGLAPICCGSEAILLGAGAIAILVGGVWLGLGILHSGPRVTVARGGEQRRVVFSPGGLRISF